MFVGWWLMAGADFSEIKVPLVDCWWLVYSGRKYYWLVADKPNEQCI
jgi:hypothetical protein